jgi:hypothetical protein
MQATMQTAPGAAAVLAVLEQEMHSMLRLKLELQTELQLVTTLANIGCSSSNACAMQLLPRSSAVDDVPQVPGTPSDVLLQRLQQLVDHNQQLEADVAQLKHEHNKDLAQLQAAVAVPDMSAPADGNTTSSMPLLEHVQRQQQMLTQLLQALEQQQQHWQQGSRPSSWHVMQTAAAQVRRPQLCGQLSNSYCWLHLVPLACDAYC